MAKTKKYIGIILENDQLKVAVLSYVNKKLSLNKLDKFTLLKPLERHIDKTPQEDVFENDDDDLANDSVFDLNLESSLSDNILDELDDLDNLNIDDDILGDLGDDLDIEIDELEQSEDGIIDLDLVDEASGPNSNEMLFHNILASIDTKKVEIGLNIPSGIAIYQILKDLDFKDVKKKDLQIIIDDRLESLYGTPKAQDFYSYDIREDGALLLTSIDEEPSLIRLVNRTLPLFNGKINVEEILPDEALLIGLVRANYDLDEGKITCLLQFSEQNCRVLFLKGSNLWLVSPIIQEGYRNRRFLNTVFSKILFQLDTGEVPNLDRLIICNNSLGEEATSFFQDRFPDVEVNDFTFKEEFLEPNDYTKEAISPFTAAIGIAWATSGFQKEFLPKISFVPKYVSDRQKILKLDWHGYVLLILILLSFPTLNSLIQKSSTKIVSLENEITTLNTQLNSFAPTVSNYNRISNELSKIQDKLELMNTLAENSITWTTNLNLINSGIDDINSVWLTSFTIGEEPNTLEIQGISRNRSSIPLVAKIFADATLLNVSASEIRGEQVFNFSYSISKIVSNTSVYSPDNLKGLEDLVGN